MVEIELRDLKTVLDDVVIGDHVELHAEETHDVLFDGWAVFIDAFMSDRVFPKFRSSIKKRFSIPLQRSLISRLRSVKMDWNSLSF